MDTTMPEEYLSHTFRTDEYVDAIAVQPHEPSQDSSPFLAVAVSALESNVWGGGVVILNGSSGQRLCASQVAAGVSAVTWTGETNDVVVFGCDNGDVQLVRLTTNEDGDMVLVPVAIPGEATRPGHDDVITGVAASALEKTIFATASWDRTVKLWDATAMDKTLTTLDGHSDLIWDVVHSPSEAHILATASQDATVQLWDDREVVQGPNTTFSTLSRAALTLDWHPSQSHMIAVGVESGDVLTFDTRATKSPLSTLSAHEGAIHCIKYSPTAPDLLAVGSDDATVSLIRNSSLPEASMRPLTSSPVHHDYVRALAWYALPAETGSPSRTLLASGSWDHTVRSWTL